MGNGKEGMGKGKGVAAEPHFIKSREARTD